MNNYGNLNGAQIFGGPNAQIYGGPSTVAASPGTSGSSDWASILGSLASTGASIYGQQNAAEAATHGNQSAINNETAYLGNISNLYQPQYSLGTGAFGTLGKTLGINGAPADYSNFLNMPGYQFAVQQGTQAIQRQAAANGTAYTPNTSAAIGQYVTGTAMQDYNTYVNQLLQTGGFGAQATQGLGNLTYGTGANTSQLMANIGQNQAGMYAGLGGSLGAALGGANSSGLATGIGNLARGIGNWFSGGNNSTSPNNSGVGNISTSGLYTDPSQTAGSGINPWTGASSNTDSLGLTVPSLGNAQFTNDPAFYNNYNFGGSDSNSPGP